MSLVIIETKKQLLEFIKLVKKLKPNYLVIDTETTGLHLTESVPFLFQFGFKHKDKTYTYAIDLEEHEQLGKEAVYAVYRLSERTNYLLGHNIKFDLHMLKNKYGFNPPKKLQDTQIIIRLAHDALTPANGGPPLGLKEYATQFITRDAKLHEQRLRAERTHWMKTYNTILLKELKHFPNPPEGYKTWTKGALEELFKDVLSTYKDLPIEMHSAYEDWFRDLPEQIQNSMTTPFVEAKDIPYNMLNRKVVIDYGLKDIEYTIAVHEKALPVLLVRKNEYANQLEQDLIRPLWDMERVGFYINKEYIKDSRTRLYDYIKLRRERLYELVNEEVAVGQHARIKNILNTRFAQRLQSTGADVLDQHLASLKHERDSKNNEVIEFIEIVQELRTLEKWYSTYLLRFINESRHSDRIYTQINQVGTVTGRVTSDFQQFPRGGIKDKDGNELFNPRTMVLKTPGDEFSMLGYLDYSQIELRVQAIYTILVDHPDLNLCRAYMPYKCYDQNKKLFDYTNPEHIARAYTETWWHEEDNEEWHPVDVHGATAKVAFPGIDENHPEWKKYRSIGKTTNFAKNYGAQFNRIKQMFPDYDDDTINRINDAYYKAFPGVKSYHEYCYNIARESAYAVNLFGVRYYGLTGHKLINTLVQGSSAYFLKERIVAVHKYLNEKNYKTRFQMNIHDELSFEVADGEEHVLLEIKEIMETFIGTFVPIVVDLETSTTTWSAKQEVQV